MVLRGLTFIYVTVGLLQSELMDLDLFICSWRAEIPIDFLAMAITWQISIYLQQGDSAIKKAQGGSFVLEKTDLSSLPPKKSEKKIST